MGVVTGSQWIAAEAIEQIHQQHVWCAVRAASPTPTIGLAVSHCPQQPALQLLIHPLTPVHHLSDGGPAQQASLGPGMARTCRFVIGVEQHTPALWHGLPVGVGLQQEGVKKPGGVPKVPLGGLASAMPWSIRSSGSVVPPESMLRSRIERKRSSTGAGECRIIRSAGCSVAGP